LLGARLGHVFFYDWEYFRNHLIEILPIRENSGGNLFGFITGWEFTGYQGLASHGAAISIISQCIISVKIYYKTFTLDFRPRIIAVASGAIFCKTRFL
jgi:prolipoprotein diacylglyceryltransferase